MSVNLLKFTLPELTNHQRSSHSTLLSLGSSASQLNSKVSETLCVPRLTHLFLSEKFRTYKHLFLVGLYDESNEGGKRFFVRGGALVAIPGVYKNSADVELYVKNRPDNWAATLKYSTMGQEQERFYFANN